jgi:hypothetical protein
LREVLDEARRGTLPGLVQGFEPGVAREDDELLPRLSDWACGAVGRMLDSPGRKVRTRAWLLPPSDPSWGATGLRRSSVAVAWASCIARRTCGWGVRWR